MLHQIVATPTIVSDHVPLEKTIRLTYRFRYWDIAGVKGKAWSYDQPSARFKDIKDYLSFYAGPWDCYVDGEKVQAQPGDFYGKQCCSAKHMHSKLIQRKVAG